MTEVFFNCASPGHLLMDRRGIAVDDFADAVAHADGFVRSLLMKPSTEDWRDWELHVTDESGAELFKLPFAAVIGKLH